MFLSIGLLLLLDTLVYLGFSNRYYCHRNTMLRVAAIYNVTVNSSLLYTQQVHVFHSFIDVGFMTLLVLSELAVIIGTLYKYRREAIIQKIIKLKGRGNTVQPVACSNQLGSHQVLSVVGLGHVASARPNIVPQINNYTGNQDIKRTRFCS